MCANFQNKLKVTFFSVLCLLPFSKVMAVCSLAVSGMSFGEYDVSSPINLDSIGTINLNCTNMNNQPQTVSISMGVSSVSNLITNRKMKTISGNDTLNYNLFLDATYSSVWGNTIGLDTFTQTIMPTSGGTTQSNITVFGRIPAGQDVSVGVYSDSVTVTILP